MRQLFTCVAALALIGCSETAAIIDVRAQGLSVPADLDGFCLSAYDSDEVGGGEFSQFYAFGEDFDGLPQSLTILPGAADTADVVVRGYHQGIEIARTRRAVEFAGISTTPVVLDRCPAGTQALAQVVGGARVPPGTRAAVSVGRTGSVIVAIGPSIARVYKGTASGLDSLAVTLPEVQAVGPRAVAAVDLDGDCDDDLVVVSDDGTPTIWRRSSDGVFAEETGGQLAFAAAGARTVAFADVDGDGDIDLALGGDAALVILLNDGQGAFSAHPTPIADANAATDVTSLAFGDFDLDGDPDLVVGRGSGAPAVAKLLDNDGTGEFVAIDGALPELPLQTRATVVRDIDGDGFPDLLLGAASEQVRLYVTRDGRLEDRSFVVLPNVGPVDPSAIAAGDWDGDCLIDVIVGLADGSSLRSWVGTEQGQMMEEALDGHASGQALLSDVDDDGAADLVMLDAVEGITWARR